MQIQDTSFNNFIGRLREKYGEEIFELEGIGSQLNLDTFSEGYFNASTTADISIDANSNVSEKTVVGYTFELPKAYFKFYSIYKLWKEIKNVYGEDKAEEIIEQHISGDIYIHDFHTVGQNKPYCFNFSTKDIMDKGLPMIHKIKSDPPKHLFAFKSQVEQFSIIAANSIAGATGLGDFLLVSSYYVDKVLTTLSDSHFKFASEEDAWIYIKETFTSFIYTMNQPTRASQSIFSNISIYDRVNLASLREDYIFPDGSKLDVELVMRVQGLFIECMNEVLDRTPATFPVTTGCLSVSDEGEVEDLEFLDFIASGNEKFGFINVFNGSSSTVSGCCFKGDQEVLIKGSNNVFKISFKDLYEKSHKDYKTNLTVFNNGNWNKAKLVKLPIDNKKLYRVTTVNNKTLLMTDDHINVTYCGDKEAKNLTVDDYLMFSTSPLNKVVNYNKNLTYNQGFLIGAFLGDGTIDKRDNHTDCIFSLSSSKNKSFGNILEDACYSIDSDRDLKEYIGEHSVIFRKINSKKVQAFIKEWTTPKKANKKRLNLNVLLQSSDFREGILDGMYATDGGNSNRIYSTSKGLIEDLEVLITSLGKVSTISVSDRTNEETFTRGEKINHNFPLYCIRYYSFNNKSKVSNVYKRKLNSVYFKIKSIEELRCEDAFVYCFEMKDKDNPYFTLPNGIITHNCRLRSDTTHEFFNSFGAGKSKIGSIGVVSINFPRLAYKAIKTDNPEKYFYKEARKLIQNTFIINDRKRNLIKKAIDAGLHPLYTLGFMELKKQYSTVGVNGWYEAIKELGYDITKPEGVEFTVDFMEFLTGLLDEADKEYGYIHNVEQVPGENFSVKAAYKDYVLGYQDKYRLYSNQFIPLIENTNILNRINVQGKLDKHFSGGSVLHLNIGYPLKKDEIKDLIKMCAEKGVVYWAANYVLKECSEGHMTAGNGDKCDICGSEIVNEYTRVVGFLVNTKNFNKERRIHDYPNRKWYDKDGVVS